MFETQLSQIWQRPIGSFEDVRGAFADLAHVLKCCQVTHFGTAEFTNEADDNADEDGSTVILEQRHDGTYRTGGHTTSSTGAHALLVRRGTTRFANKVFFDVPPALSGAQAYVGTASANWTAGAPPTVAVTHGTLGGVTVRLRNTSTQDPNIRSGDTVVFMSGDDGNYHAFDSQLDSKIGTVKFWLGTAGNIPPGWRRLNASGTYNANDRFIKGIDSGYTNMGSTGGSATHTHTGTTDSGGSHDHGGSTGAGGDHAHGGATATGGSHDHGGTTGSATPGTDSQLGSGNTDYATASITIDSATTGITVSNHSLNTISVESCVGGAAIEPIQGVADEPIRIAVTCVWAVDGVSSSPLAVSHVVNDSGHTHTTTEPNSGSGHRHALSSMSHSHTVNSHSHTISSQAAHDHSIATSGTHTHTISNQAAHTHTFTTGSTSTDPQYLVLAIIERFE